MHKRASKNSRRLSPRELATYLGASLSAVVLALAMLYLAFAGAILNHYGKKKAERAFAEAYPGCALRIGKLNFSLRANRLVAQSVTLSATNTTIKSGRVSLTGVRWAPLIWGATALADVLDTVSLEVTNLDVQFPPAHYGIRCARLRISVPRSDFIAERTELQALVGDEAFFAAHDFRTTRFHVVVPECRAWGVAFVELLQGTSCRARLVHFTRPSVDALVNCDKPVDLLAKSPLMVHEALAALRQPLRVETLSISNGHLTYCERVSPGAKPGVLTLGAVNISVEGIANHGEASAAIRLQAQGDLMDAGTLKLLMSIPIAPPALTLRCSGSLSAMDLTHLNAFLEIAEHTRIKSGSAQQATFEMDVTAGQAHGWMRAIYKDLEIAFLDEQTGTERSLGTRLASFLANALKVRHANGPNASGSLKEGEINYTRRPDEEFQQFVWFALRTGILDIIGR